MLYRSQRPHVPLYNHMYSSETACVDRIRLLFSSPSRAQRRPQRPTTMRTLSHCRASGPETACHDRTRISSTLTAAIDDPLTARCDLSRPPCVSPRPHAACGNHRAMGHDQGRVCLPRTRLRVTCMQSCAPLRTRPTNVSRTRSTRQPARPSLTPASPERNRAPQNPLAAVHTTARDPAAERT